MIRLACLDMAGTTVLDDGAVVDAFDASLSASGLSAGSPDYYAAIRYVHETMGQSKIDVFQAIFDGDLHRADAANSAFEAAYAEAVQNNRLAPIPQAAETIEKLRGSGCAVVLTTGFAPATRDHIIAALGWGDLITMALSPVDAGRGRPYPDMVLTALLRTGIEAVDQIAVAGDTTSDLWAGSRAGAAIVAGVRTGAHSDADFATVPHTHVLDSVAELVACIDTHNQAVSRWPR
ncbi:HAD family hydrolase [Mycobacterium montefiorense]|uniref:Haloacid dehalogenase-like hydrolase n=1 Tax=Mycobacterium montefiorense TaxID=154654 RepID=A0AA37PNR2_9MYCO|nr:HAD family hydrolase [Mycobacterium montefiorense]GBG37714.1 putative haloacid dehalogenase-like hydrolase [Mycobacterium montefiorense]GKU34852.1 putative haloacid dehalogenase-like hydrolase [Mycobacterium montefiorense]GKU40865.1 putative haloacid dehalogenase-like hydrolase [Mycobacterium montefiorense]GKU46973.1 putative haloacid dehalogenase-like hydrolase [Mycobacterium montefiorense]GKU49093.1 putative haloacid dehalogenase-like hydrolase [Mycobacterium montefiorense]